MHATHTRLCSVNDCGRVHRRNGLCDMHDQRMKRTGTTDARARKTQQERFWEKVDTTHPEGCWIWTAATNENGYGVLHPAGRRSGPTIKAHRYSAELAGMDIVGRFVLHACDQPLCVNPAHLRAGDHRENMDDMLARQRQSCGETSGTNKLTEQQVAEIRELVASGMTQQAIADRYGIARSNVSVIANRRGWRHVS